jgi:hypothetical protein
MCRVEVSVLESGSVVLEHPAAAMVMRVLFAEKGISL